MISLARSSHKTMAVKAAANIVSSGNYAHAETGSVGRCQEPNCDCSGRAADAVRNRAFSPRPAGVPELGVAPAHLALSVAAPASASLRLTPARCRAIKLAGQFGRRDGPGGAVPSGTGVEPRWNRQPTDIASLFSRFQRFHVLASRDARVPTCACRRAHIREGFAGTLEPLNNAYVNQEVSGSKAVPKRFQLGTGEAAALGNGRFPPISNILAGGYAAALLDQGADRAASTVMGARGRETFGVSPPAWGLELGRIRGAGLVDGNGGFPPFSGAGCGPVGRVMLEGMAERRGNASFWHLARQPVRLARRAAQADRGATPPMPPFARRPAPCMVARAAGRILIGLPEGPPTFQGLTGDARARQSESRGSGSGSGSDRAKRKTRGPGRGSEGFGCSLRLRRSAHHAGGRAHVN